MEIGEKKYRTVRGEKDYSYNIQRKERLADELVIEHTAGERRGFFKRRGPDVICKRRVSQYVITTLRAYCGLEQCSPSMIAHIAKFREWPIEGTSDGPVPFTSLDHAQAVIDVLLTHEEMDNTYEGDWQP